MRRLSVTLLFLALVLPAGALAAPGAEGDGTLSIKNARGTVSIAAHGAVIGRLAVGRIIFVDPIPEDGTGPVVNGAEKSYLKNGTTTVYFGTDLRFRLIGGSFKLRVAGTGINLSAVGRGDVWMNGDGELGLPDGVYAFNGDDYHSLPNDVQHFDLAG